MGASRSRASFQIDLPAPISLADKSCFLVRLSASTHEEHAQSQRRRCESEGWKGARLWKQQSRRRRRRRRDEDKKLPRTRWLAVCWGPCAEPCLWWCLVAVYRLDGVLGAVHVMTRDSEIFNVVAGIRGTSCVLLSFFLCLGKSEGRGDGCAALRCASADVLFVDGMLCYACLCTGAYIGRALIWQRVML